MRVGFVTEWFPPESAGGVAAAMADALAERGHQIDVVTGFPNYPSGRLAPGYRLRPYQQESRNPSVTVHRAPLIPSHDRSPVRRMATYLSFAGAAAVVAQCVPRPDVWLTYSSPVTSTLPALVDRVLAPALGRVPTPHAQVIQDLWPDSVTGSGMVSGSATDVMERALHAYCDTSYRHSAAIGVISPSMRRVLVERGVPDHVILDTPNWAPGGDRPAHPPRMGGSGLRDGIPADARVFLYAGNLGELQALDGLIDGVARVPQAHLVLMGPGVVRERLSRRIREERLDNVHLRPPCAPDAVAGYLADADALVVSLADTPLLRATMPSKVQSSLAAGRPVFVHAAGDAAAVVADSGAGIAVSPGDPGEVASAVAAMSAWPQDRWDETGARARAAYEQRYSPQAGGDALEALILHATRGRRVGTMERQESRP